MSDDSSRQLTTAHHNHESSQRLNMSSWRSSISSWRSSMSSWRSLMSSWRLHKSSRRQNKSLWRLTTVSYRQRQLTTADDSSNFHPRFTSPQSYYISFRVVLTKICVSGHIVSLWKRTSCAINTNQLFRPWAPFDHDHHGNGMISRPAAIAVVLATETKSYRPILHRNWWRCFLGKYMCRFAVFAERGGWDEMRKGSTLLL